MKKYTTLVIWIVVFAAILTTAYVIYDKYSDQLVIQPPQLGSQAPNRSDSNTGSNNNSGSSEQNSSPESDAGKNSGPGDGVKKEQETENDTSDQQDTSDDDKIMAPDFTLKDLEGNDVSLSDYQGKIVILNFWAVWCKYCVEEMPDFNELNKELEQAGDAVILAVNVQEPYDTINKFLTESDIDLKVLMDEDGYVAGAMYGVDGYPTTFIINDDGSLYTYIPGKTDIKTLRTVLDMARNNEPLR